MWHLKMIIKLNVFIILLNHLVYIPTYIYTVFVNNTQYINIKSTLIPIKCENILVNECIGECVELYQFDRGMHQPCALHSTSPSNSHLVIKRCGFAGVASRRTKVIDIHHQRCRHNHLTSGRMYSKGSTLFFLCFPRKVH